MPSDDTSHDFDADNLVLKLNVKLAADQKAVDHVVHGIMQVVRRMDCAPGTEDAVELAPVEALANAIVHGAKSDASKSIECDVACDQHGDLLIVVRDPGKGFDPANIPSPVVGQNIYSNHGRGIFLINQLMDEVKFQKNGTEIRMVKRLKPDTRQ
jgi:serine/threonine-protein kinase RsbW